MPHLVKLEKKCFNNFRLTFLPTWDLHFSTTPTAKRNHDPKNMFNSVRKMRFMLRENVSHCLKKKLEFPLQRCDLLIVLLRLDSILYLIYNEVLNKDNDPQRSFWWILYSFSLFFSFGSFYTFFRSHKEKTQFCITISTLMHKHASIYVLFFSSSFFSL